MALMTSIVGEAEVLKIDERGRVRVPVERREALLDEFEKSGMSGAKFARLAGIKYATFANWTLARRKARSQESPSSEPYLNQPLHQATSKARPWDETTIRSGVAPS